MRLTREVVLLVISVVFLDVCVVNGSRSCPENCKVVPNSDSSPCDSLTGTCSLGCEPGYYGDTCNMRCDVNCESKTCQNRDGSCICSSGYTFTDGSCKPTRGVKCKSKNHCLHDTCVSDGRTDCLEGCKPGWYGQFCEEPCSAHCVCDRESGNCTSCIPGWYGAECGSHCSAGCLNNTCNKNGTCVEGCTTGLYGETCDLKCSAHCVSGCDQLSGECVQCEAGQYGSICQSATDFPETWKPFIIGGGLFLIFVVLALVIACCLKRMQDIMKDGVHLIGPSTAVQSVPDHCSLLRSVDTLHTGSKACGGSSDDTYDHLFAIKPPEASICLDDLETSSGYCAVRPLCGVSDQLLFESDDVNIKGSDEEGDIGRSLISLYEGNASDQQEIKMEEETAVIKMEDVKEPDENVITDARQKITDEGMLIPEDIKITGADDEDDATSMEEAVDGGSCLVLGEQETEENSPSALEDCNISVFTDEEGSINDTLIEISDRG